MKGWCVLLAAALSLAVLPANAQTSAIAPNVSPPRLEKDSPARYPEKALRDRVVERVVVELILEIDAAGVVKQATITTPSGHGFDEAAASAASMLVFSPATRDGAPIAAKIRFSYAFDPPPARVTGRVYRSTTQEPIEGATIVVHDAAGLDHRTVTDARGVYRVDGVKAGKIHLHVEAPGREPGELDEELAPGEEADILLRLVSMPGVPVPMPVVDGPYEEVRVHAARPPREVTRHSIPKEEIALIPGTNGDALRSLQNLPGVARPPAFGGQLVVRGSAPQDTNYFVDGTNIPLVYHFGGLSSVLPTEVLDRIDFYPGNYGAQYGRGMGGIIDVGVRGPKDDGKLHGMAQIDLIDARVLAERSLGKGWSFLVAGRRSYFDLWLAPILEESAGVSTAPRYYDYQVMLKKELSPGHELRFFFFGSDDRLEIFGADGGGTFSLGGGLRATTAFWRAQARYLNRIDPKTRVTATLATGEDLIDFGLGANYLVVKTIPTTLRAEITRRIARMLTLNAGVDLLYTSYDVSVRFPRPQRAGVPDSGLNQPSLIQNASGGIFLPGAYAEAELTPARGTRIIPGVRADYIDQIARWDVSPRVVVRQDLTRGEPRTTVKGGAGMYYQPPQPVETDVVFGTPNLKTNRSVHYSLGMEQTVGAHVEVSVEAFYKSLDRLVVQDLGNTGDGRVYGAEWLLRWKNDARTFGWVAYTLMRSERRESENELLRLSQYDQTHILTALVSRELGKGWRIGARFRLVSGNLYTPDHPGTLDIDRNYYQWVGSTPPFGSRLGAFHQLDVRIDKTFFERPFKLAAYLDVQNVYIHRSEEGIDYNYNATRSEPVRGLPILPILGVRGDL